MNRIYKVIWNKTRGMYMVVSELAKGQSKDGRRAVGRKKVAQTAAALAVFFSIVSMGGTSFAANISIGTATVTDSSGKPVTVFTGDPSAADAVEAAVELTVPYNSKQIGILQTAVQSVETELAQHQNIIDNLGTDKLTLSSDNTLQKETYDSTTNTTTTTNATGLKVAGPISAESGKITNSLEVGHNANVGGAVNAGSLNSRGNLNVDGNALVKGTLTSQSTINGNEIVSQTNITAKNKVVGMQGVVDNTLTSGNYVTAGNTVGENIVALDTQVKANADQFTTDKTSTALHVSKDGNLIVGTKENQTVKNLKIRGQLTSGSISTGDITSSGDVSVAGKVEAEAVYDDTTKTGNYVVQTNSVGANLSALDTQIKSNADAITAEATARADADTALTNRIAAEETDRAEADTALQNAIDKEATDRKAADTTLQTNIDNEAADRQAADAALDSRTTALEDKTEAITYDKDSKTVMVDGKLTATEGITDGTTQNGQYVKADNYVGQNLNALDQGLQAETTARQAADTTLQTNIDNEAAERTAADTALDDKITAETSARVAADTKLVEAVNSGLSLRNDNVLQKNITTIDAQGNVTTSKTYANEMILNKDKDNQITLNENGIKVGTNSTVVDKDGVYTGGDTYDAAKAALKSDGSIKGADGKFTVNSANGTVNVNDQIELNGATGVVKSNGLNVGDGNFKVNSSGGVTAAGGKTTLASDGSIKAADGKFTVNSNGGVKAADGKFTVDSNGAVKAANGNTTIDSNGNLSTMGTVSAANGKFTVDTNGAITSTGLDAGNGTIQTTGTVKAGDVQTGTLETTGDATIGGNLTVDKNLTVNGEFNAKTLSSKLDENNYTEIHGGNVTSVNSKVDTTDGKTYTSTATLTEKGKTETASNGINRNVEKMDATESSDVITNDANGQTSTFRQKIDQILQEIKASDTAYSKVDQAMDSITSTVTDGTNTTSVEQGTQNITNTAKQGTISNIAKDLVNTATGDMTNTVGGKMLNNVTGDMENKVGGNLTTTVGGNETHTVGGTLTETVTGKATENYNGGLETTITGEEKHTVNGDQTNTITGKQTTTVIGDVTEDYKANLSTTVGGNQTTTVAGDSSLTAENITNTAKNGTIANDAKDIINNAAENMTNTVGKDLTTTVGGEMKTTVTGKTTENYNGGLETTITGEEKHTVNGSQINAVTGDQTNTIGGSQTTTVTGDSSLSAQNITNTASETLSNSAKNITNTAAEKLSNSAAEIENTATKSIKDKVGENVSRTMTTSQIKESVVDGANSNTSTKTASKDMNIVTDGTSTSTLSQLAGSVNTSLKEVDGEGKTTKSLNNVQTVSEDTTKITDTASGSFSSRSQKADGFTSLVKNGSGGSNTVTDTATKSEQQMVSGNIIDILKDAEHGYVNTTVKTSDESSSTSVNQETENITSTAKQGTITNEAKNLVNKAAESITNTAGTQIQDVVGKSTVTTTDTGTTFENTDHAAAIGEGSITQTTISGNTLETGKATADYVDVNKDLHVMGNTKLDGTLEVAGKSTFKDDVTMKKDLSVGGNATVAGDVTAKSYKVGDKTYIGQSGLNANNQKVTNVADGEVAEGSKDAVNGGQLHATNQRVSTVENRVDRVENRVDNLDNRIDKVGASAAAMANLHPMDFDEDSKVSVAAAMGSYRSETAGALGVFYRPTDRVMLNVSTSFGNGENMVGGGVSFKLGKSSKRLEKAEATNAALAKQVTNLQNRLDALLGVLNPSLSKDFPDVPANHWAYEAVSRLAGNDIVQGYEDGKYHGERTMTRYEMAEIIYNALSKGAKAEAKLVEEFRPELQAMAAQRKA
ncbi:ESPR-type extended signal peptide-containing protein [uncultured Acidaminococcus sp.]|uniref:ESPR-type extended signal peptide-containing protein n=1 Tax=uncultured Acidaminococcus sp. TaxID=352152 RepID=UPI0028040950|nr:ESPR-type extended signal peptide-containing protein [uncultured Acidaminococcus sp.]